MICHPFPVLPKIIPFTFGDEPLFLAESTTVQCSFSVGDMPVKVTWLHDSKTIPIQAGIETVMVGKKVNVLTIDQIREEHSGNYTCLAENAAGATTYTAELIVNG